MGASSGMPVWAKMLIIALIILGIWFALRFLLIKYPGNKFIVKVNLFFKGIGEGFASIKKLKQRKGFVLHTLFIWSMYLLQIYIGFMAMEGTEHLSIKAAFSVLALATLAMIATPGGLGSFPIFVMQTLLIYGIASPLGKAFGWIMWGVSTGIIIVAGCIALAMIPYMNKHKHEKHSIDPN